jgi:hypothetical protein
VCTLREGGLLALAAIISAHPWGKILGRSLRFFCGRASAAPWIAARGHHRRYLGTLIEVEY